MAEKFRFFDSQVGDVREYNAAEFAEYFETLIDTGLIVDALNELNPTVTGTNMIVTVDTGNAFINGRWYENDSSLNKTFDTETVPNDRIDLLVLRLDLNTNERKITFEIVKGTPSTTPVAPTLTRTSVIYELGLAEVFITGGQSFIAPGDLTDLREITTTDPFSFPTASSKVVAPQTATNTANITALKRFENFINLTEIGISDSSLSSTDFGANVLTIINALSTAETLNAFVDSSLATNLTASIDNELGLSVASYRIIIDSFTNNNVGNLIKIIPNNTTDFYIGSYDNTFLGMKKIFAGNTATELIQFNSGLTAEVASGTDLDLIDGALKITRTGNTSANRPGDFFTVLNIPASSDSDFQLASSYAGFNDLFYRGRKDTTGIFNSWTRILTTEDRVVSTGNVTFTDSIPASSSINKDISIGSGFRKGKLIIQNNTPDERGVTVDFDTDSSHTFVTGFSGFITGAEGSSQARAFLGSVTTGIGMGEGVTDVNALIVQEVFITGSVIRITFSNTAGSPFSLNTRIDWSVEK